MILGTFLGKRKLWLSSSAVLEKVLGRHRPILKPRPHRLDETKGRGSDDGHPLMEEGAGKVEPAPPLTTVSRPLWYVSLSLGSGDVGGQHQCLRGEEMAILTNSSPYRHFFHYLTRP